MPLLIAVTLVCPVGRAGEMTALLDCAADDKLLDTRFVRFGPGAKKGILRDGLGVRFKLPPSKDSGHTGIYSYVSLAGDFEITAKFSWAGIRMPKAGYGASAGLTVDTDGPAGSVSLARANRPVTGGCFALIRGKPGKTGNMVYENSQEPTKAPTGRFCLRREKNELICLAAEGEKDDLRELKRFPFTDATVKQVRVFADPAGSDDELDARVFELRVMAEEITVGVPERDKPQSWGWWPYLIGACVVVGGFVVWRRRRARDEEA